MCRTFKLLQINLNMLGFWITRSEYSNIVCSLARLRNECRGWVQYYFHAHLRLPTLDGMVFRRKLSNL